MYPLKYMMNKIFLTARTTKWIMFLTKFDLEFINHKSIKGHVIVDQLSNVLQKNDIALIIELLDSILFDIF